MAAHIHPATAKKKRVTGATRFSVIIFKEKGWHILTSKGQDGRHGSGQSAQTNHYLCGPDDMVSAGL